MVAAGTHPNTIYEREFPGSFKLDKRGEFFQGYRMENGKLVAVAEGETGLIRVLDLANVWSVMAVQTEDLGVRRGDGFELIGRAAQAEPRGCSLMNI